MKPIARDYQGVWFRIALGVAGLVAIGAIVHHVGADVLARTLRGAIAWLPAICSLELFLIASETAASYIAFRRLADRIPRAVLFRAHLLGHSIAAVAPAPTVVRETIKATLLTPYVGVAPATSVAFINQAATLISVGVASVPCGVAIFALGGASVWFWACGVHAVILVACGVGLQAVTRGDALGRWLVRLLPRLGPRVAAFREHASETGLLAAGPTSALLVGRAFQIVQLGLAANAVGIPAGVVRAMATQGVNLVAAAVGVLVPAGLGTTDGAFALAAKMLDTTLAQAVSLALLMRCSQLAWLLIGSVVALVSSPRTAGVGSQGTPE
jgi:hypothetical protein